KDALKVYEALEKYFDHLQKQAESGYKYDISDPEKKPRGRFKMYFNEWILLDNNMMAVLDNAKLSVVPHTAINYMISRDLIFTENQYKFIQNLMQRSTLISEVSEKERSRFFRILRERIGKRKESLKV
ncbi:MAG TPA: hypothetical protein VET23_02510, partial [Chitinophagaceae bacterium]|nr:hypothetical protein [Chitinophagaceae bacterium]